MATIVTEYYYKTANGFGRSFALDHGYSGYVSIDDVEQIVDAKRRHFGKEASIDEVRNAAIELAKQRQKGRGAK